MTALLLPLLLACNSPKKLPTAPLQVGGHTVTAELAITDDDRTMGLMHRESMGTDDGMLFVYPDVRPRSFWMKNTLIPLSIAFADRDGQIVKIADMEPHDTSHTKSVYPAMYALEMNQGWFEENGVKKGDRIEGIPKDLDVR